MRRHRPTIFAFLFLFSCVAFSAAACASGPEATGDGGAADAQKHVELAVDDAIRPWVLDREAGMVIKMRLDGWEQIRPMVERFVHLPAVEREGEKTPGSEPLALLDRLSPAQLPVGMVDPQRPAYFVFDPRIEAFTQACLYTGVPCLMFEPPSPRFFRFLVPSDKPEQLAEALESISKSPLFEARALEGWVHVEALGGHLTGGPRGVERDWSSRLERRFQKAPRAAEPAEVTAAKATVLNTQAPVAAWANIRAMIDLGVYVGNFDAAQAFGMVQRDKKVEMTAYGTILATQLFQMDVPAAAEFDDVGLVLGGDGEGSVYLDSLMSRTKQGSRVAEAARGSVELPEIALEGPDATFEGALKTGEMREAAATIGWAQGKPAALAEMLRNAGIWGYLGLMRAPAAFQKAAGGGNWRLPAIPGIRGLRVALSRSEDSSAPFPLVGGATVLLPKGEGADTVLRMLPALNRGPKWVDGKTVERGAEAVEVRVSVGAPMDELFPEDGARSEVGDVRMSLQGEAVATAAKEVLKTMGVAGVQLRRALERNGAFETFGGMSVDLRGASTPRLAGSRLFVGSGGEGSEPEFVEMRGDLGQPEERCLVELGHTVRSMLREERAGRFEESALLKRFNLRRDSVVDGAAACLDRGATDEAMVDLAVAAYETYRAMLAWRHGEESTAREALSTACERGLEWTCEPGFLGDYPWVTAN